MIAHYVNEIRSLGGKLPSGYQADPKPMQIAKLDDALRKARNA